jgi:hypothetical protein
MASNNQNRRMGEVGFSDGCERLRDDVLCDWYYFTDTKIHLLFSREWISFDCRSISGLCPPFAVIAGNDVCFPELGSEI